MNTKIKATILITAALALSGCSLFQSAPETSSDDQVTINPIVDTTTQKQRVVNTESSSLEWEGSMISGIKTHQGAMGIKEGMLGFNQDNQLVSGSFVIDMNSMDNFDEEGEMKKVLIEHLKSADFFNVEAHPEARLEITSTEVISENNYAVTADLTIKDITNSVQFNVEQTENEFVSEFTIDRTRWDVRFGSNKFFDNLKDGAISDEIKFNINLITN